MRSIKRVIHKHFNCMPWLIVGIQILTEGNISRWQYFLCWMCTLILIWHFCPIGVERRNRKVVNITDHEKVV